MCLMTKAELEEKIKELCEPKYIPIIPKLLYIEKPCERESGYYFALINSEWEIIHYQKESNSFTVTGNDEEYYLNKIEFAFDFGDKIELPNTDSNS